VLDNVQVHIQGVPEKEQHKV